nr:SIR2 family protein [Deinococcus xianganensis]
MSRRYYDLPDWPTLLKELCGLVGINFQRISTQVSGDLPSIASVLASEFHPIWFENRQFEKSRRKFEGIARVISDPLKFEAANIIASKDKFNEQYAEEIDNFSKIVIDGVITTNYDTLLERVFGEDLKAFIGQSSMLKAPVQKIGEIYKIHGCITKPQSLTLTLEDYKEFNRRNFYIAAILTQIFTEHPIIFLGYSISDPNIRTILSNIVENLDAELLNAMSDRFFFVERCNSPHEEAILPTLMHFGSIQLPVTKIKAFDYSNIYRPLMGFQRSISPKILRLFKETAYTIALQKSPEKRILTAELSPKTDSELEFVFGHGVMEKSGLKGVFGIDRDDILQYVINGESAYSSEDLWLGLRNVSKNQRLIPSCSILVKTGRAKFVDGGWQISLPDDLTQNQKQVIMKSFLYDESEYRYSSSYQSVLDFRKENKNVKDVIRNYGRGIESLKRMAWLKMRDIEISDLREYLINIHADSLGNFHTVYVKLIMMLDFLENAYQSEKPKKAKLL